MPVTLTGARELALRFDTFPDRCRAAIEQKIRAATDELQTRSRGLAPRKTGRLQGEIVTRVFSDSPTRVAGYVEVYASDEPQKEYPKAATLEYGSDKPRRKVERASVLSRLLGRPRRRIVSAISRPVHIKAFMYLRGPLEELRPEIEAALEDALTETAAGDEASA